MSLVMEYAVPYRPEPARTALSREARTLSAAARNLDAVVERSFALFGPKAVTISQIWELASECADEDWDGDGGAPISARTIMQAIALIRALPVDVPLPELAPEPDGAISMDWIESRHRLFSLSVGESNRLAYAWLDGTDRGHAVARFDGAMVPPRILEGIRRIVDDGDVAIWAR